MKSLTLSENKNLLIKIWIIIIIVNIVLLSEQFAGAVITFVDRWDEPLDFYYRPAEAETAGKEQGSVRSTVPGPLWAVIEQLDLATENNFATYFNSINFLLPGLLAFLIAKHVNNKRVFLKLSWILLGICIVFLAAEEVISFRGPGGLYGGPNPLVQLRSLLGISKAVFYFLLVAAGSLWLVWTTSVTFSEHKKYLVLVYAALSCWAVSIIIDEFVLYYLPLRLYRAESFLEEFFEIAGSMLLVYCFAKYVISIERSSGTGEKVAAALENET